MTLNSRRVVFSFLISSVLLFGLVAFIEFASAQGAGKGEWKVNLATNSQAKSTITIRNQCKQTHSFTVVPRDVPFLQLPSAPTIRVPGHTNQALGAVFNTAGMPPGDYRGSVTVKCETCGEERGCSQENEQLPVHLIVSPAIGIGTPTPTPPREEEQDQSCKSDRCKVKELILNTGYDQSAGAPYSPVQPDGYWELVDSPNPGLTLPSPAWVINANSAWQTLPNSGWISAYNNSSLNVDNHAPDKPYSFQRCFCTCDGIKSLDINLKMLVDNVADVYFDGVLIGSQTDQSTGSFNTPLEIKRKVEVKPGKHCLRIDVRNLSGVAMGLNVEGTITSPNPTGAALLLSAACCNPKGKIIGQKINDKNCDGKIQGEPGLPGWTITATNTGTGAIVTTVTDANGFYYFNNLAPGTYTISETAQAGWTQSLPGGAGTYTVTVAGGQVIQKDFANCRKEGEPGRITGKKIDDKNCNAKIDINEPGLAGWAITATNNGTGASVIAVTDANGFYSFPNLPPGTYTISEATQGGWSQTSPAGTGTYTVTVIAGQAVQRDFLNCKKGEVKECATVTAGEAVCKGDGSGGYTYTFSVTNNSGKDVVQILLTPKSGSGIVLSEQVFPFPNPLFPTPLHNGQSTTITVDIGNVKPGTPPCFLVTLMTKDGPCCTVEVCPVLPDCCATTTSKFECDPRGTYTGTFTIVNTSPNIIKNIYLYPPAGVTMSQTYFAVTLAPGQSFTTPVITIKGAKPGRFCFRVSMHTEDMKDCCVVEVCIMLPECGIQNRY
jgi:hypothetical protein